MTELLRADSAGGGGHVRLRAHWHSLAGLKARRAQRAARRTADAELLRRETAPLRLAWRVEELTTPKNRLTLANTLRSLIRDASPRYLPSASPVNRLAIRTELDTLLAMVNRLSQLDRPVAARGVLLVDRLLVDGAGPLYDRELADELPVHLDRALTALEPR
jgi:hypothetical protein